MSNNPFNHHYNTNPFCSQTPLRHFSPPEPIREVFTLSTPPKESSTILYILFFFFIFFILIITILCQMSIPDVMHDESPYVIKVSERTEEYKNFVAPKNGTVKLSKGVVTQVHHAVKEDSVIILSRKSIDGKAGSQLIVTDIIPNKKFTIKSMRSTEGDGEEIAVETEDCGEIYFAVI